MVERTARIETLFIEGPAGRIECLIKHPHGDDTRIPPGVAVVCHPHPMFGGTMHNKVVHAAAESMVRAGLCVVRFNFRGVGGSGGSHDGGNGEQEDLAAVLDHLAGRYLVVSLTGFVSAVLEDYYFLSEDPRFVPYPS